MAEPRPLAIVLLVCVVAFALCPSVEASVSRRAETKKLKLAASSGEDDDSNDDDDEREDDAGEDVDEPAQDSKPRSQPQADEEAGLKKAVDDIEAKLTANLAKRTQTQARATYFDDKRSSKQIEDDQNRVAKEMQSPAMAEMLATMWKELRMFEVPSFKSHANAELAALKKESEDLQAALGAANTKLKAAKKTTSIEVEKKSTFIQRQAELPSTTPPPLQTLQAPPQSQWSFWQWPTAERRTTWLGTAVYFCFGLMFAFLYDRARIHAKALLPQRDYRHFPTPDGFSFGLFDCFSDANICVVGCCCPCIRWADTLDRQQILPYWQAFVAMFVLMLLHISSCGLSFFAVTAVGVVYRRQLYLHYEIEKTSVFLDVLAWFFCQPCAIIQEAREASVQRSNV